MKIKIYRLHFIFSLLFAAAALWAEPFRVAKLHIVNLEQDEAFESSQYLGLNDALALYLPENRDFIEGIEIKMNIPEQIALWQDCCACYIYENINPLPTKEQIDFSGNKIFFEVLPGKLSWILQIPLKNENHLKTNQYTKKLDRTPNLSNNLIFLRMQQIMKGIPDTAMNSKITMTIRPILADKGLLKLNIDAVEPNSENYEEKDEEEIFYTLFIDDVPVEETDKGIILDTGIHNLSLISENYRTEVRTVRIDQAKTTELDIQLKSIEPTIIITTPESAEVFLDEEPCEIIGKEFLISEGEHKIKFIIGDYEIIRSLSVFKGKTYKVNLAVDLQINEE